VPFGFQQSAHLDAFGQIQLEDLPTTAGRRKTALQAARREYWGGLQDFRMTDFPPGSPFENLCELLDSCRQDGVRTVLLLMPEGPAFRSWYPPGLWPRIRERLGTVAVAHGAPLIDAHEWMAEDDFYDSHHLTLAGATLFTERLGRAEFAPLLRTATQTTGSAGSAR
jgi:hypothetical protein